MKNFFIGIGCCIFCIAALAGIFYLLYEPTSNDSKYDKQYVARSAATPLQAQDISQVQKEVLNYVDDWVEIDGLKTIWVMTNQNLESTDMYLHYMIPPINEYKGFLEVICKKNEKNWSIVEAKSCYSMNASFKAYTTENVDKDLQDKINESTIYINNSSRKRISRYIIKIVGDNINIQTGITIDGENEYWEEDIVFENNRNKESEEISTTYENEMERSIT